MNKIICLILTLSVIQGCSLLPTKTEYVKVSYPILVCPAPPITQSPELYINRLTVEDSKDYKKVAQYYNITLQQLTGYIDRLELIINRYDQTSKSYEGLKEEVNKMTITPIESKEILD